MHCSRLAAALVVALAVASSAPAEAVERTAVNSIYVEGLGSGVLYSVNYERIVAEDVAVRAGLSYFGVSAAATSTNSSASFSASFLIVPLTASYLGLSNGTHTLELGGGVTPVFGSVTGQDSGDTILSVSGVGALGTLLVGYRAQPVDGGFQFRVGLSPLIGAGLGGSDTVGAQLWGYLSLGSSF